MANTIKHVRSDFFLRFVSTRNRGKVSRVKRVENIQEIQSKFDVLNEKLESEVDFSCLNYEEREIHRRHADACKEHKLSYMDPSLQVKVMTRWRHYLRGSCCGSACRHCVYEHEKVPEDKRVNRTFNSAFWKDK